MALKCDFLRYNHIWQLEGQLSRDLGLIGDQAKRNIDAKDGMSRLKIYIFSTWNSEGAKRHCLEIYS